MERTIRSDDDPEGLLARYTVETASRDYFRAFAAWMRDPISGGHEWSPKERDAVKRIRQLDPMAARTPVLSFGSSVSVWGVRSGLSA